jgi:hypothetical protein
MDPIARETLRRLARPLRVSAPGETRLAWIALAVALAAGAWDAAGVPAAAGAAVALVLLHALALRTVGARAAAYALIVLATMPAWFLRARTGIGSGTVALPADGGFAAPLGRIAYGIGPWVAVLPPALAARTARGTQLLAALTLVVALAAEGLQPGTVPAAVESGACLALAICLGAWLADLDAAGAAPVPATVALAAVAVAAVVTHDLAAAPERVLEVLGGPSRHGPAAPAARLLRLAVWAGAAATALAAVPRPPCALRLRALSIASPGVLVVAAGALGGAALRVVAYPALLAGAPGVP